MEPAEETFTEEEKELITPFFTNLDKPIFALINLPEVVKGALFSRYSRTTKSLRRVLLDEFILKPEMGFKEIVGNAITQGESQIIAIKKAEEFYDRVLVGYGDDSVAELGGANLACEQISQIAAKFIEGARIGISPLEKSTRYVWFNQKVNGKYQYYREPVLMNSEFANIYLETCDLLFDTYSELIDPMTKFFMDLFPKEEGVSDRAYNSAIRAKACDVLRVFLPASTLTNVGLYGSGRAFEYLLTKMYAHQLIEIRNLAVVMHEELNKVIPSFVKRCNDKYGKEMQNYISETSKGIIRFVKQNIKEEYNESNERQEEVILVDYDSDVEIKVLSSMLYPHTCLSLQQVKRIIGKMNVEQKKEIIKQYLQRRQNRRHKPGRALESSYYRFDILANYGIYRDLQRHRLLTQEAQDLTVRHGYDTPKELVEAGYEQEYGECMKAVESVYNDIYKKYPKSAQYIVTFGYKIRWYMGINLREICHLTELRSMQQGHPDYRRIAQNIYLKVKEVHPMLAEHIKFIDMNEYKLERIEAEKKTDKKLEELQRRYKAN